MFECLINDLLDLLPLRSKHQKVDQAVLQSRRTLLDGTRCVHRIDAQQEQRRDARRDMQMIFQDPYASLNPRWRVHDIIAEPIRAFGLAKSNNELNNRIDELLIQVGLSPVDREKFPHEFSGGQRQRISIARALSSRPEFLVCDEPTSALDVSVQAQILNLIKELQRRLGLTYLFISHDLSIMEHICHRVAVMYAGRVMEIQDADALFSAPRHPYTKALRDAVPIADPTRREGMAILEGEVPSLLDPPSGCRFHPRCRYSGKRCASEAPEPDVIKPGNWVRCHFHHTLWEKGALSR